jgi:hypothetical protein
MFHCTVTGAFRPLCSDMEQVGVCQVFRMPVNQKLDQK